MSSVSRMSKMCSKRFWFRILILMILFAASALAVQKLGAQDAIPYREDVLNLSLRTPVQL